MKKTKENGSDTNSIYSFGSDVSNANLLKKVQANLTKLKNSHSKNELDITELKNIYSDLNDEIACVKHELGSVKEENVRLNKANSELNKRNELDVKFNHDLLNKVEKLQSSVDQLSKANVTMQTELDLLKQHRDNYEDETFRRRDDDSQLKLLYEKNGIYAINNRNKADLYSGKETNSCPHMCNLI